MRAQRSRRWISLRSGNASKTVFATYELLEDILSRLVFIDLIHAQQVCQHWRALTSRSKVLRQLLFLEAVGEVPPPQAQPVEYVPRLNAEKDPPLHMMKPHPLFEDAFIPPHKHSRAPWEYGLMYKHMKRMLSWRETQWQDMFVVQPPIQKVFIRIHLNTWAAVDSKYIEDVNGVRFSDVVKGVNELLKRHGGLEASERWLRERSGRDWDGRIMVIYGNFRE